MAELSHEVKDAKKLIDEIHTDRASNDPNSTSLANTLEANIHTVFNSAHKFIYELLQNADDARAKRVEFTLAGSDLIISHDGDQFTKEDVKKLCDNAKTDSYKARQLDKTGYKGVGFKAVFCISKRVTVVSYPYCWRFDQVHWQELEEEDGKYPWPIIPIWTDASTLKLPSDRFKVHFVLSQIETQRVQKELDSIFQSTEVLLLLRHIEEVKISPKGIRIWKTKKDDLISLERHEPQKTAVKQFWLTKTLSITVPPYIRESLQTLSAAECPDKLKQASEVDVTFAASVRFNTENKHYELQEVKNAHIYSYLPTQVEAGLPYLINGNFLLNQDRTLLMNNVWNRFLLEMIGRYQFSCLAEWALIPAYKNTILSLLAPRELKNLDQALSHEYRKGFDAGIMETSFIPGVAARKLLKVKGARVDNTQFFKFFLDDFLARAICDDWLRYLVAYELVSREKLLELKESYDLVVYDYAELLNDLDNYLEQSGPLNTSRAIALLEYLHKQNFTPEQLESLRHKKIILCEDGKVRPPKDCYLAKNNPQLAEQFQLAVVHPEIVRHGHLKSWLDKNLKISPLNKLEIIRNTIKKLISENGINAGNSVRILRFIYSAVQEHVVLRESDYHFLQYFQVLRRDQELHPINSVFFQASPASPMDIPNNLMLRDGRDGYIQPGDEPESWKNLLIGMGIRTEVGLTFHRSQSEQSTISVREVTIYFRNHPRLWSFSDYYKYLAQSLPVQFKQEGKEAHSDSKLVNFITYDFLNQLDNDFYYSLFWRALRANWQQLQQSCTYKRPPGVKENKSITIPHYLSVYLQRHDCIRVFKQGVILSNRSKTSEVFAPGFMATEFRDLPLPIADIPGGLSNDQARGLGFKMQISFEDCLKFLALPECCSPNKLTLIYRALLALKHQLTADQIAQLRQCNALLAANLTMQPMHRLRYYDLPGVTPESGDYLHTANLNVNEIEELIQLFDLRRTSKESHATFVGCEDKEVQKKIDSVLRTILPILAILEKRANGADPLDTLKNMHDRYRQIKIYTSIQLNVAGNELFAYLDNNILYVSDRWEKSAVREQVASLLGRTCFSLSKNTNENFVSILCAMKSSKKLDDALERFHIDRNTYQRLNQQFLEIQKLLLPIQAPPAQALISPQPAKNPADVPTTTLPNELAVTISEEEKPNEKDAEIPGTPLNRGVTLTGGDLEVTPPGSETRRKRGGKLNFTTSPETHKDNIATGKWSERYVFKLFRQYYEARYQAKAEDTPTGFKLSGKKAQGKKNIGRFTQIEVVWLNKKEETGENHDLEVKKDNKVIYVEVKGTKKPDKQSFPISEAEVRLMKDESKNYHLYRVFNARSEELARHEKIKNPRLLLAENKLKLEPEKYRMTYAKK